MKFKHLVVLNGLVVFGFGAAFILRPLDMMALYGVTQSGWGVTGLLAVTLIGFGMVLLGAAYAVSEEGQLSLAIPLLLANLLAFGVTLAQQQALWNTRMGWVTVCAYLLFVVGYGYLVIKGMASRQVTRRA
jgi:hypothetical protein